MGSGASRSPDPPRVRQQPRVAAPQWQQPSVAAPRQQPVAAPRQQPMVAAPQRQPTVMPSFQPRGMSPYPQAHNPYPGPPYHSMPQQPPNYHFLNHSIRPPAPPTYVRPTTASETRTSHSTATSTLQDDDNLEVMYHSPPPSPQSTRSDREPHGGQSEGMLPTEDGKL